MARVAALALSAGGLAFVVPRSSTSTSSLRGVSVSAPAAEPTSSASWGAAAATATAALGLAAASATSATRRTARKAVGVCLPLTDKFDPLNLASTDEKLERYTQVEIKHGRVAMIAVVGYIMPEIFRFPGCESFQHGLAALESIPLEGWVQLAALVGAHEVLVKPRAGGLGTSDFGLGTELLDGIEEPELERKLTAERNNGRLAMVAIMGLMVQDGMFGEPPLSYMSKNGWWGEGVQYFVQHLNNCQSFSGSFVDNAGVCALPSRQGRTA
uniref:PCPI-1 n=1 Tax=Symbiodinium sp. TaxID=2950 RepID=UPI0031F5DABD